MNPFSLIVKDTDKGDSPLKRNPKKSRRITISFSFIIILIMVSVYLLKGGIRVGANALTENYEKAYEDEKMETYQNMYENAYNRAEKKYHVSNRAVISIGSLRETSRLEIIKANDVEIITEDRDENSGKITAWLEVTGEGTFVVDLQAAEFIIDDEHQYVLARVPHPALVDVTITDEKKRLFKDDWGDENYRKGVNLALKQRNEASMQIQKSLMANQYVYQNAKAVAESMIQNLVKQLNPDIPELTVEVEFMD